VLQNDECLKNPKSLASGSLLYQHCGDQGTEKPAAEPIPCHSSGSSLFSFLSRQTLAGARFTWLKGGWAPPHPRVLN